MIWLLLICFSALPVWPATVSGRVTLRDSRDPVVRKRRDYSGVVISLKSLQGVPVVHAEDPRAMMLQKDKTFSPHVLAISVGTMVAFPNADPIFHNAFSSYNGQMFDVG